jgi:hypothetical protein
LTTTTTDRVALLLDVLGHEETDLLGQVRLWRHRDGRYLTADEADMVAECTVGEMRQALDLHREEVIHLQEQADLNHEFMVILDRFAGSAEPIADLIRRLPSPARKRATEIWAQIGPEFEMWRGDQP